MKWWINLLLVAGLAVPALAQEPTTQPAEPELQRPMDRGDRMDRPGDRSGDRGADRMRPMRPRGPGDGPPGLGIPPTAEEIEQSAAYMKENFPRRYAMFENLPERGPLRERMTHMMVDRYRRAMHLQTNQPEIYEQLLEEQKLVDEAFGMARDIREGKEDLRVQFRIKVREIVENSLAERRQRIERLETQLQEQKSKLAADEDRMDELVEKRMAELERENAEMAQRLRERREAREESKNPQ